MLESILKLGTTLSKKEQRQITGGMWPRTEEACHQCGGEWYAPLCALPHDSPCAS
ncbi:hypothetical protein U8527_19740 [Kordia algicida OT-1]|uniref:Uncharacterized protein n=1 Tax=Kordia algicida OT-1 TaxID=391587 RepID=A9DK20_9FLAO|nr:hypothetical protein [Kordia algicida]EDP98242.1 hypothetical protein KAOT1_13532 [Kordia algicida OT-1]